MSFEFIARTPDTKTKTIRVIADREVSARTKLESSGYSVVALIGVSAVKSTDLVVHAEATRPFRSAELPSKKLSLGRHWKLSTMIAEFFAPFNLIG